MTQIVLSATRLYVIRATLYDYTISAVHSWYIVIYRCIVYSYVVLSTLVQYSRIFPIQLNSCTLYCHWSLHVSTADHGSMLVRVFV